MGSQSSCVGWGPWCQTQTTAFRPPHGSTAYTGQTIFYTHACRWQITTHLFVLFCFGADFCYIINTSASTLIMVSICHASTARQFLILIWIITSIQELFLPRHNRVSSLWRDKKVYNFLRKFFVIHSTWFEIVSTNCPAPRLPKFESACELQGKTSHSLYELEKDVVLLQLDWYFLHICPVFLLDMWHFSVVGDDFLLMVGHMPHKFCYHLWQWNLSFGAIQMVFSAMRVQLYSLQFKNTRCKHKFQESGLAGTDISIFVTRSHKMIDKSHFDTIEILYILKEEKMLIIVVKKMIVVSAKIKKLWRVKVSGGESSHFEKNQFKVVRHILGVFS